MLNKCENETSLKNFKKEIIFTINFSGTSGKFVKISREC